MQTRSVVASLVGTVFFGFSQYAFANAADRWHDRHDRHSGKHHAEHRLVDKYDRFAGSERNAQELVDGLRHDQRIDLSRNGKTTSFTPATGKMGWGNVDHALALAKASLAEHGVHNPTPEQIKAALNGGSITTKSGRRVALPGVLKLRASGMGWGEIAHKLGVKPGDWKHANGKHDHKHKHAEGKHDHKRHDHKHADRHHGDQRHDHKHVKHHGRPDFHRAQFERPDRVQKIDRPEKFERPHRPEKFERPERHGRK